MFNFLKIIFFSAFLLLISCITKKRCAELSSPEVIVKQDSVRIDSVTTKEFVIVHDTLKYMVDNPCRDICDEYGRLKAFNLEVKNEKGTKLKIFSKGDKVQLEDDLDGLSTPVDVDKVRETRTKFVYKQTPAQCKKKHLTTWRSFFIVSGYLFWIIVLFFILKRFLLKYINKF
jgi:hypothetical protein